jgi:sarcosine oxidase
MNESYDAIVVGLGAMGSATVHQLARRGQRVLGIDMFQPGHDQGSSHGYHRMIRMSSFQDDGYVPLADRAFELWREAETEAGEPLLHLTGEIWLLDQNGNPGYRAGVARSLERGFRVVLDGAELAARFPGCRLHEGMIALYEASAGYLRSEAGIIAHVELARRHGATIRLDEEATGWTVDGAGVAVATTKGRYRGDQLIVTTGAWAAELLASLGLPLEVQRTVNGYFQPAKPEWWTVERGAPDFLIDVPEGSFYGMPAVGDVGVKIGRSGGQPTTARTIRRTIDDAEIDLLRATLDRYLPGAAGAELRRISCMCTYTPDRDFVVGRHPEHAQVQIGCGFSGRGYKFAPVIGEILADLATTGATRHDIGFLSPERFGAAVAAD